MGMGGGVALAYVFGSKLQRGEEAKTKAIKMYIFWLTVHDWEEERQGGSW